MKFIDSHAHLDLSEFKKDMPDVIQRAKEGGIENIITIGIGIQECKAAMKIAEEYPSIYAAIGIHPHNAKSLDLKNSNVRSYICPLNCLSLVTGERELEPHLVLLGCLSRHRAMC